MTTQTITPTFEPYPHQVHALRARASGARWIECIWHRRGGKDITAYNGLWASACKRVGNYVHVFPEAAQGRKVWWDGMDNNGKRLIDYMPKELIAGKPNETEMRIEMTNGSAYQVVGADHLGWIGGNMVGAIMSEYQRQDPMAWQLMTPIMLVNGGWAWFAHTPLGHNHAYTLYQNTKNDPAWFVDLRTIHDTKKWDGSPIVTDEMIEWERKQGKSEALIEQEYYCSFEGNLEGAVYGELLKASKRDHRVTIFEIDRRLPVMTAWDLGMGDATAIGFFQRMGNEHRLIDYYENRGKGLDHYADILRERKRERGYQYQYVDGNIVCEGPHDIKVRELGTGKSRLEQARKFGLHFRVGKKLDLSDGISAVRKILPTLWVHEKNCERLIEALTAYRYEWDEVKQCFDDKPVHDWCFTGETEVLTRHGMYPIMDLPQSGEVLTLCGWKPYTNPRITRRNARLVEVEFSDGLTVRCTPDHTFLTASGWISAESLTKGSVIQSTLTPSRSISMVGSTVFGHARHTLREAVRSCTEMFGKWLSALSHVGATFTTGTAIHATMFSATLSAFPPSTISLSMGTEIKCLAQRLWREPLNGIGQKRGGCGIAGMRSGQNPGSSGSVWRSLVHSVKNLFNAWKEKTGTLKSIAAQTVKPLHIVRVTAVSELADVWCLTVPDSAHFSLSNGAVVHNCSHPMDMLRYYAVASRDDVTSAPPPPVAVSAFDPWADQAEYEFNPYAVS